MRCGLARVKSCSTVASTSFVSCGEALAMLQATGRPWRSAIAMFYCLFRGESGRQQRPFFRRTEAGVHEGLRADRVCRAPVDLRRGRATAESACHRAATVESGDGRFDRADSGLEDRAKERRCVKPREFRSAQLAHRARADLDRRDVAWE